MIWNKKVNRIESILKGKCTLASVVLGPIAIDEPHLKIKTKIITMSLRPGVEHSIQLWKKLPENAEKLKSCFDLYEEVFSRICDRKKAKHLVDVENKFAVMFDDGNTDIVKSIGTKDLRQMIELKHTKCKARPLFAKISMKKIQMAKYDQ